MADEKFARRFCKGDNEWTEWTQISAAEYEKRRGDPSFEFKDAPSQPKDTTDTRRDA